MRIPKKLKIALGSFLGVVLLLFIVLVAHIAMAKPVVYDNATWQISRIDFKEPIDSLKAKEIHRHMKATPGVKNDKLNIEKGVMVYYHDNRIANSKQVFDQLLAAGNYKAERLVISGDLASHQVCPVMKKDGFSYKFSRGIQRIFN
jgi:hypothetical protein